MPVASVRPAYGRRASDPTGCKCRALCVAYMTLAQLSQETAVSLWHCSFDNTTANGLQRHKAIYVQGYSSSSILFSSCFFAPASPVSSSSMSSFSISCGPSPPPAQHPPLVRSRRRLNPTIERRCALVAHAGRIDTPLASAVPGLRFRETGGGAIYHLLLFPDVAWLVVSYK